MTTSRGRLTAPRRAPIAARDGPPASSRSGRVGGPDTGRPAASNRPGGTGSVPRSLRLPLDAAAEVRAQQAARVQDASRALTARSARRRARPPRGRRLGTLASGTRRRASGLARAQAGATRRAARSARVARRLTAHRGPPSGSPRVRRSQEHGERHRASPMPDSGISHATSECRRDDPRNTTAIDFVSSSSTRPVAEVLDQVDAVATTKWNAPAWRAKNSGPPGAKPPKRAPHSVANAAAGRSPRCGARSRARGRAPREPARRCSRRRCARLRLPPDVGLAGDGAPPGRARPSRSSSRAPRPAATGTAARNGGLKRYTHGRLLRARRPPAAPRADRGRRTPRSSSASFTPGS